MPDITMCKNEECKLKEKCFRFTAIPSTFQSYFYVNPNENSCEYFYNNDFN